MTVLRSHRSREYCIIARPATPGRAGKLTYARIALLLHYHHLDGSDRIRHGHRHVEAIVGTVDGVVEEVADAASVVGGMEQAQVQRRYVAVAERATVRDDAASLAADAQEGGRTAHAVVGAIGAVAGYRSHTRRRSLVVGSHTRLEQEQSSTAGGDLRDHRHTD